MTKAVLYQTCTVPWDIRCLWQSESDYPVEEQEADPDKIIAADASCRADETAHHNEGDSRPHHWERSRPFV